MIPLEQLEQKIIALAEMLQTIRAENDELMRENSELKHELDELKADNEKITFECLQLATKVDTLGVEEQQVSSLHQERERAKEVVESLIKDIDLLISREKQL